MAVPSNPAHVPIKPKPTSWLNALRRALGRLLSLLETPLPLQAPAQGTGIGFRPQTEESVQGTDTGLGCEGEEQVLAWGRVPRQQQGSRGSAVGRATAAEAEAGGPRGSVLLVTAHPDDECMFFAPSLSSLRAAGAQLWLLCLSTGDADGKGTVRREELLRSCRILQICESRVIITDDPLLQDGMRTQWPDALIADYVAETVRENGISLIVTFDRGGVSGHANHLAVHAGVLQYLAGSSPTAPRRSIGGASGTPAGILRRRPGIPADTDASSFPVPAYELVTTGTLRTFLGPLETLVSAAEVQLGLGTACCCVVRDAGLSAKAMAQHSSQLLWYRRLYVLFSRYSYVNTLKRMNPSARRQII